MDFGDAASSVDTRNKHTSKTHNKRLNVKETRERAAKMERRENPTVSREEHKAVDVLQ